MVNADIKFMFGMLFPIMRAKSPKRAKSLLPERRPCSVILQAPATQQQHGNSSTLPYYAPLYLLNSLAISIQDFISS